MSQPERAWSDPRLTRVCQQLSTAASQEAADVTKPRRDTTVRPDHEPTPATILGGLLSTHPEARSLLAEASHRQTLAACSAADTTRKFNAAQAARLAYEELRHRLEPRRSHPLDFGAGLLLLLVLAAALAMLVVIELSGLLGGLGSALPGLGTTAVWLTVAWLGAVAVRRRRWVLLAPVIGVAVVLGLLLVALHGFASGQGSPVVSGPAWGSMAFGVLAGACILLLAAGAAVLMAHLEPASLFAARRRWHRARAAHAEAVATEQADLEAAAVATEAWLGLVRAWATMIAAGEESLVGATVALAAALPESGRPQLPPPL
jgi:hypothetical protein